MNNKEKLELTIGNLLINKNYRLAVAESCTGGLISNKITNVAGSSAYFDRGYVTYSNRAKLEDLSVSKPLLERCGAVSKEVAIAMAEGARKRGGTDIAVAVTGIAGPSGGTEGKPVGTLHIAVDGPKGSRHKELRLNADRLAFKERAAETALEILKEYLSEAL